jgi:hypothetical protein
LSPTTNCADCRRPLDSVDCYGRSPRHPAREYLLEIDFAPPTLPIRWERYAEPEGHPESSTCRPLTPDRDGHVHAVADGFGPGVCQIRWNWS